MAQWKKSERSDSVRFWIYQCKTETDCFNVIAQNESEDAIGTFAVKFAEDSLLKKGKQKIGVQTTEDNAPALSLYKKCGFVEVGKHSVVAEDNSEVIKVKLIKYIGRTAAGLKVCGCSSFADTLEFISERIRFLLCF